MGDRATYRAIAARDGRGWTVRISGLNGSMQSFHARDLADVEPRALKLIWGYTGTDHATIDVDVHLPAVTQDRLDVIGQHCADIEAVVAELVELGLPLLDVARVLELHHSAPRPLTVTNAELATHGLDLHPDAVGLEWDEHGFALTRLCRRHVDAIRATYRDLEPDGLNALVYGAIDCDRCHEGDEP